MKALKTSVILLAACIVKMSVPFQVSSFSDSTRVFSPVPEEFINLLDEVVPLFQHEFQVPGSAVALIRQGDIIFKQGYGYSDADKRRPVTPETVFNVASISKSVAAWGILHLVEQEILEMDGPVEQYLTRWKLPDSRFDAAGVTVRRLLSHTAGLSLHGYPGWGPDDELPVLEESLSGITNGSGDVRLIREPGSRWQYSGGGYTLLQLLIEEVTGLSFDEYMRNTVLEPLGMLRSGFTPTPDILAGSSTAFNERGEPTPSPRFTAQAAAGLYTTVEDLAKFAAAAVTNTDGGKPGRGILNPETVTLMMTPAPGTNNIYGLGYSLQPFDENRSAAGHSGANRGWHALFHILPDTGDGIVVVTNGSNGWIIHRQVYNYWVAWLAGTGE